MLKHSFLLVFIIGTLSFSKAQGWQKMYGSFGADRSASVDTTSDGGYILTGYSSDSAYGGDVLILKTNGNGDSLWSKRLGRGPDEDEGFDIKKTSDNGYIITGVTWTGLNEWLYLLKTDSNGDTLWTKKYRSGVTYAYGLGVQQLPDGGYAICGGGNGDFYILRTDNVGDTLWTKRILLANYGEAKSIVVAPNGDFVVTGYQVIGSVSNQNIFIARIDSLGTIVWTKMYGGPYFDDSGDIENTSDGNFAIAGEWSYFSGSTSTTYPTLLKINPLGDTIWAKRYNCVTAGRFNSLKQTSDGGYILLGNANYATSSYSDMLVVKTNSVGDTIWTRLLVVNGNVVGNSIMQTSDGGYILTGTTYLYPFTEQCVLIKLDGNGNIISVVTFGEEHNDLSKPFIFPNCFLVGQELRIKGIVPDKLKIEIADMNGIVIETISEYANSSFKLQNTLSSGIYIYRIYSKTNLLNTGKLIVSK